MWGLGRRLSNKASIKYRPATLCGENEFLTLPVVLGSESSRRGKTKLKISV